MKLPDNIVKHIQNEAARVHHGRIIIEINHTSDKVDVVTEARERFKNPLGSPPESRAQNAIPAGRPDAKSVGPPVSANIRKG